LISGVFGFIGLLIIAFAFLYRVDKTSYVDRQQIKTEQEISKRERAENRAHILRLEAEILRLKAIIQDLSKQ
jgi:hypothetical protein